MKATGVVRRIDELGRIVVPKEIRKNFRIKNGENIEIFIDGDSIILKKYSTIFNLKHITDMISKSLYQALDMDIIITDNESIISNEGVYSDSKIELCDEYFDILDNRKVVIDSKNIIMNVENKNNYIISPINLNGDVIGGIIIFSKNKITKEIEKITNLINKILINYIEQ